MPLLKRIDDRFSIGLLTRNIALAPTARDRRILLRYAEKFVRSHEHDIYSLLLFRRPSYKE